MYKKLTYEQLLKLKSGFFTTLSYILKKSRYPTLKDYLTITSKQWNSVYHMLKQDYIWRTVFVDGINSVIFFDEREKIELHADKDTIAKIASLIKDTKKVSAQSQWSESIEQTLTKAFDSWLLGSIDWKDYLVYDIETSYASNDLRTMDFYLWYAYVVQSGKGSYRYIDSDNLYKFLEFMLEFDGYIIGFNSLAFDNPVTVYSALQSHQSFTEELYQSLLVKINKKSLDIFQFIWNITTKRMGLNKLSRALVGVGKTLESGKEWEWLRKQYHEQGDESALKTLKDYCKNDVKMTYLCLWYILYYKKLSLENEDCIYSIEEFLFLSNKERQDEQELQKSQSEHMFS
jgi:hypothetical protein